MARKKTSKVTNKRSPSRRVVATSAPRAELHHNRDIKEMIRDFAANPAVKYVAGGIATAILTKLASSLSGRYPEISRLLNENLENFEGKLREFRGGSADQLDTQH